MSLPRLLLAVPLAMALSAVTRADDTAEFLAPSNWEGRADIWRIENGAVVGETKEDPKYNTFFCSKKQYGDFELSFKVRLKDGVGNSGVQIRSEAYDKEKFRVRGPQVDVGKGYWGSLYGEGVGGMMRASNPEKIKKAVKESEWNEFHIVAKGPRVTIKINGETMVDQDFPTLPKPTPPKKKAGAKDAPAAEAKAPEPKPAPMSGIIAFQAHAGYASMKVEYTDIKFTDLSKK